MSRQRVAPHADGMAATFLAMNQKAKQDINSFLIEANAAIEEAREVLEQATVGDPAGSVSSRLYMELCDAEDKISGVMFKIQRL